MTCRYASATINSCLYTRERLSMKHAFIMTSRFSRKSFILAACGFSLLASSLLLAAPVPLKPDALQSQTTQDIVKQLSRYHYASTRVDDTLSSTLLKSYIEDLDPGRSIFIQSDLTEFEAYNKQLDDQIVRGKLDTGFLIFNRYRERLVQQLEDTLASFDDTVKSFNFTKNDELDIKPENNQWPANIAEQKALARLKLKGAVLSLRLSGKDDIEIAKLLKKRYKNQLSRIKELNSDDAYQIYMNALTRIYDPHTSYFSPSFFENFNINMKLSLEGIGAVLQKEDEYTKVVRLVHAGPADKQGELKAADKIIRVGQGRTGEMVDVIGWRLSEVVKLIRGSKGTVVRLEIVSDSNMQNSKIISIVRNKVKLEEQAAKKRVLELNHDGRQVKVGVIDIPTFYMDFDALRRGDKNYKSTTRDVKKLLDELLHKDKVEGIVLDLRDNGGGSLNEANDLTGLFIDYGATVQIRNTNNVVRHMSKQPLQGYYGGPLAVLINRQSASASEIVAAALQDYNRAIIIGEQSFGKGTVQSLKPLSQGQLKLTESKFYRISGGSTQHKGVIPDIKLPSLYDHNEIGESALDGALPWDKTKALNYRHYFDLDAIFPKLAQLHQERSSKDADFIYIQWQVKHREQQAQLEFISLNEVKRKTEEEQRKAEQLAVENKRRKAKGLELLPDFAAFEKSLLENKEQFEDIYLFESARIMLDSQKLLQQNSVANK